MKHELYIPIRIVSEANLREHWSKRHKRHKNQKALVHSLWNTAIQKDINLPAEITLTRIAPRALDPDNLASAFKNFIDIISDLIIPGLAPGRADGDPRMKWKYCQKKGNPKEYALLIEIEDSEGLCVGEERISGLSRY